MLNLISFILSVFVSIHIAACFWFMSSRISNYEPNTWVVRNQLIDEDPLSQYLASLYWSISTVLTVGYGDIHAETDTERLFSMLWMMIGVAFYSFTIGILSSIVGKMDTRASQLNSKLEVIDEFCNEAKISHELKRKVIEALEYHSKRNAFSYIEKFSILNELPSKLKCEIAL